jgi:hypothetical protein
MGCGGRAAYSADVHQYLLHAGGLRGRYGSISARRACIGSRLVFVAKRSDSAIATQVSSINWPQNWQAMLALISPVQASFSRQVEMNGLGSKGGKAVLNFHLRGAVTRGSQAALRMRDVRCASIAAILMRLLTSTAAPTNTSKRSGPWARHRFMPRPRNRTEMRPSMPARKR